jgi:uncharacterized membrane protein YdfJ with MMPL/SSD domain
MNNHPPSPPHGLLARLVGSAAGAAARRPKRTIALWLMLIVACTVAGSLAGTKTLSDTASTEIVTQDLQHSQIVTLPVTLVILVLAFGALVAASVPLLLGLTSVAAALGALGLVSQIAPNGAATDSVVVVIGLAVAVDYSLFYIRRERARRAGVSAGCRLGLSGSAELRVAALQKYGGDRERYRSVRSENCQPRPGRERIRVGIDRPHRAAGIAR